MAKKLPVKLPFRFNSASQDAIAAAEKHAAEMVTGISAETEAGLRSLIATAIREGKPAYDAARAIRSMIGLTSAQGQAAMKYRDQLIDNGLTLEKVNDEVDKYSDELLAGRADMIASTEIMSALNDGEQASWEQAQEDGLLSDKATKVVIITDDACDDCVAIADEGPVPIDEDFSEDGPPFHPRCRCAVGIDNP